MTKQEFLATSLPYGLKMCYEYENRIDIHTLLPMHFDCNCQLVNERGTPILHPLSDITKEIEHKGEKFVPYIELLRMSAFDVDNMTNEELEHFKNAYSGVNLDFEIMAFSDALKLIEWYFDIAGLIEKGDAIDVNTLIENPYK